METTRFTAMKNNSGSAAAAASIDDRSRSLSQGCASAGQAAAAAMSAGWSTLRTISPSEMVTTVSSWTYATVGQCFSRMRRSQFDEEHQRSLLSCHTTEDEGNFGGLSEEAMLELRRRVQQENYRYPANSTYASLYYQKQTPSPPPPMYRTHASNHPQWQRPTTTTTTTNPNRSLPSRVNPTTNEQELGIMLSDAEKTLNKILGNKHQKHGEMQPEHDEQPETTSRLVKEDDVRRMSVDQLLSLRIDDNQTEHEPSTASSTEDEDVELSEDAQALRMWLQTIDPTRAQDYVGYAGGFEKQGFQSIEDLRQLDVQEIEMAMSEIGISKFAHRTRIRKAILRLHEETMNNQQDD